MANLAFHAITLYVIMAESGGTICGFACAYAGEDPVWGTLLDNLHVHTDQKGQGVGTVLIKSAAHWSYTKNRDLGFYLWVLAQNTNARAFYKNLGAANQELVSDENPGGGFSDAYRYVWLDVTKLIG